MTTAALSTEPVIAPRREATSVRIALVETFGFLGTWLRILWRHWPVLLALALGGTLIRQLLVSQAVAAASWRNGLGGLLIFPLLPATMLVAMVLMLRTVRPSLPYLGPAARSESMWVYLASVAIPFVAFYIQGGYADYDKDQYASGVASRASQEVFVAVMNNGAAAASSVTTQVLQTGLVVLGIAAAAFLLRWIFDRFAVTRRLPFLAFPALYLEVLWIYTAFLVTNDYVADGWAWLGRTRVWQAAADRLESGATAGGPAGSVIGSAQSLLDVGVASVVMTLVVPVTALVAGSVVLAAHVRRRDNDAAPTGVRRLLRIGQQAGRPLATGRFALIADALRRVFRAGVPATMVFCLAFLCVGAVGPMLSQLERPLIGERDTIRVWPVIEMPFRFVNEAIALVLLMALIAAFVDRTAARLARRIGTAADSPGPTRPASAASAHESTTTTMQLNLGGYDGERGLPQRTPHGPPGQAGPAQHPYGPPGPWPPPPARLREGEQDEPGQQRLPRDPETGWSGLRR